MFFIVEIVCVCSWSADRSMSEQEETGNCRKRERGEQRGITPPQISVCEKTKRGLANKLRQMLQSAAIPQSPQFTAIAAISPTTTTPTLSIFDHTLSIHRLHPTNLM